MKQYILFLACMATFAVYAQEKKDGFSFELGMGTSHYGNFPAVSVFADPTDNYNLVASEHFSAGYYNHNGWFAGVSMEFNGGNTAYIDQNESFSNLNIMLDIRDYFKLNERFEMEFGVAFGLLIRNNNFDFANERYSVSRLGACAHLSLGLNYIFKENHYIGIRAIFPEYGLLFSDEPKLPAGFVANAKSQSVGHGIQLSYGIRF